MTAEAQSPLAPAEDEFQDEVIITGSLLELAPADTTTRITTLTQLDLERSGADSLAQLLQALPMNTGAQLNTNTDLGLGAARINLRGLGSDRTLVLLNGRRFPNGGMGGDASVDLNMLPVSWIERIEVLPSGASVVYGSDAIGGVINVITRKDYVGVAGGGGWKITEHGDGGIIRGFATIGFNLFKGSWSVGIDYVNQQGVTAGSRAYSARPLIIVDVNGTLGYAGQNGVPDGQFNVPPGNALGLPPAQYIRVAGATGQTAADYRLFTSADRFNQSPYNYSQMPNERGSVQFAGSRPIGDRMSLYVEGLVQQRRSSQQASPDQYLSAFDPSPTLSDGSSGIPADNYYNPFGVDLNSVGRRFVERSNRGGAGKVDLWRAVSGLEGALGAWNWEASIGASESQATHRSVGVSADSRFITALGPSGPDATGRIVCGIRDPVTGLVSPDDVIPGCVPLNLFGGAGSITEEQLDYIMPRPVVDHGTNGQRTASAVVRGPWGKSLGRDLQWVFGAEYRRETGSQVGDPIRELGINNLLNPALPAQSFDVRELFAEVHVPLLHGRAGAREMGFNVGARRSQAASFGSNTIWQSGLHWQPAEEITLRGEFSQLFRAPSLFELFELHTIVDEGAFDPCGNDPSGTQRHNCAANGVPGGAYTQGDELFGVIRGGNSRLQPESGESLSVGVDYLPLWAPGLSTHVDYSEIYLTNVIGSQDIDRLLFQCAEHGIPSACDSVQRHPDGRLSLVTGVNANLAERRTRSIDFAIDWNHDTPFGTISSALVATLLEEWSETPFRGADSFDHAGRSSAGALPRWRAGAHVDCHQGPWSASYTAEYIGSMTEEVFDFPPFGVFFDPYERKVPAVLYHDIGLGYRFSNGLAIRAAVFNATDEDPPFVNLNVPENTDAGTYRLLGRTYLFTLRYGLQ